MAMMENQKPGFLKQKKLSNSAENSIIRQTFLAQWEIDGLFWVVYVITQDILSAKMLNCKRGLLSFLFGINLNFPLNMIYLGLNISIRK